MRELREAGRAGLVSAGALAASTAAVGVLESPAVGIDDASPLYLVAVAAAGILHGTRAALVSALAAFAVYDVLFTEPRFTFSVADPREWLDLLLLLFVALVIGRLVARETERAREADGRAREAEGLFGISRTLAAEPTLRGAASTIVADLAGATRMTRVWISLLDGTSHDVIGDTAPGEPIPVAASTWTLMTGGDARAPRWVAIHSAGPGQRPTIPPEVELWGVPLKADGVALGTLWSLRWRASGMPGPEEGRLLAAAADQLALALRREQLDRDATEAEIVRQSDTLKSALLDSVSHDLRTPLASIRAAAGSLADAAVAWTDDERRAAAREIDAEAERMSQLVQSILDLSRIQGGALQPELEVLDPAEAVEPVVERLGPLRDGRSILVELGALPPVRADAVLLDRVLANLLENAIRHSTPGAPIRVAGEVRGGTVELVVEDGGPGVPDEALPRLFGKFYRVPGRIRGSRPGLGIGLSIVRGFVEAMGGQVSVAQSPLGGLRVGVTLPIAPEPPIP
jgi:two-component system sensor histidine kinase KdpD